MVDKFAAQRINKKNLEKEVSDVEKKLSDAKKTNLRLEQVYILMVLIFNLLDFPGTKEFWCRRG